MSEKNINKEQVAKTKEEQKTVQAKNPDEKNPFLKFKKNKYAIFWIYGAILLGIVGLQFLNFGGKPKKIKWQEVSTMIKKNEVARIVVVNNKKAEIHLKADVFNSRKYANLAEKKFDEDGPHFIYSIQSPEVFNSRINELQKDIPEDKKLYCESDNERKDIWGEAMSWLIPIAILVLIWIFIFKRMGGGSGGAGNIFSIGKSKAKMFDKNVKIKTNFKDVAGLPEAKQEITEIVDFLKNPDKYTKLGGKIPKGALLIGPPGTGKTLLAKAVAGEAEVPFFSMSGSDFNEMFVGVGASRVRDLFAQAKSKAPCIIFIDEIDSIGRSRSSRNSFNANDERENTLNQLLSEMDGFDGNTGVIILAATNRADILDSALLRAGRFDRQIMIDLPDLIEREEIFEVHIKPIKIDENISLKLLAKQTPGFSGADIANVCNEAALIAARVDKKLVTKQDFSEAIDRIVGGLEKKNSLITEEEKRTIAYHEAGHATVGWLTKNAHPLIKVTIIPRGKALGAAWYLPEERKLTSRSQLYDELCSALGGRAAEELMFGEISSGALNDLEKVTKQAYSMVSFLGMSKKIGNVSFYDSSGQNEYNFSKPYSEKTAELIDSEVNNIIKEQYERAKDILINNKEKFVQLAERLYKKEVIYTDDVKEILGERKFSNPRTEEIINYINKEDDKKENKN